MSCLPLAVVTVKYLPLVDHPSQPLLEEQCALKSEENFITLLLEITFFGLTFLVFFFLG
jgi:hypothetical protein